MAPKIAAHLRWSIRAGALLLLVSSTVRADPGDWTPIPLGTSATLYAVGNTWTRNHLVVGANGFVARSDSSRTVWTALDPGTSADLYSVVQGANEAWMGAGDGVVRLLVYNGWFERDLPTQEDLRLFAGTSGRCLAAGPGGLMFRHDNGTWTASESGTTADLNGGAGLPFGPAWAIGDHGTILRSTDGISWDPVASGTTADLHGIAQWDPTTLYVVGDAGTVLKTTDGGATWSPRPSGTALPLRAISISRASATHLIAVGLQGAVIRSTDAGESWCPLSVTSSDLYAAEAFTDSEFLVAGEGGLLLRTTNGGGSCAATGAGVPAPIAAPFAISGISPQPSTRTAWVRLSVERERSFRAEVFDLAGRLVFALPESRAASAGEHVIALDIGRLVPGVYFLRVRSEGLQVSHRLVVSR